MLKHIVLWTVKGSTKEEKEKNIQTITQTLLNLKDKIPEIVDLEVHRNSEKAPQDNFELILISTFKSFDDLKKYQVNPIHQEAGKIITELKETRVCIDYEY